MRRHSRLLGCLVCLSALSAATGVAARAFYITQSGPDAWTVMDPEGIEQIPGEGVVRKAWAVRVQRNILTGNPPQPGYVRTLTEYDCTQTRTRWREFTAYSRSGGALLSKRNPNPEWGPAAEANDIYSAFKVVCQGSGGGSVVSADSIAKVVISLMAAWDAQPAPAVPAPQPKAPPAAKPKAP